MKNYLTLTDAQIMMIAAATRRVGFNSDREILNMTLYFETMYLLGEEFSDNAIKEKSFDDFEECMKIRILKIIDHYRDRINSHNVLSTSCELRDAVIQLSRIAETELTFHDSYGIEKLISDTTKFYRTLVLNKRRMVTNQVNSFYGMTCNINKDDAKKRYEKANEIGNAFAKACAIGYIDTDMVNKDDKYKNFIDKDINAFDPCCNNQQKFTVMASNINHAPYPKLHVDNIMKDKVSNNIDGVYYKNGDSYYPIHQSENTVVLRRDSDGMLYGYSKESLKHFFTSESSANDSFDKKCKECIDRLVSFKELTFEEKKTFVINTLFMEQQHPFLKKYIKMANISDDVVYNFCVNLYLFWADAKVADSEDKKHSDEVTDNTVLVLACEKLIKFFNV